VDFWVGQIQLTEAADATESKSDSEGSAPIPNNANANSDYYEVGYDGNSVMDTHLLSRSMLIVPMDFIFLRMHNQDRTGWPTCIFLIPTTPYLITSLLKQPMSPKSG
jgi:hypothetical protein